MITVEDLMGLLVDLPPSMGVRIAGETEGLPLRDIAAVGLAVDLLTGHLELDEATEPWLADWFVLYPAQGNEQHSASH